MRDCGCERRARWLSVRLGRLALRFEKQPTLALAQLLAVLGLIAAAGYCYGHYAGRAR